MEASSPEQPVRLVVRDGDLTRRRLTVFFRLFLAIPVFVWLLLWGIAAFVCAFVLWLGILINGEPPENLHAFVAGYVRYWAHVSAYVFLAADPWPGFRATTDYPVDVEIDPPTRQSRWKTLFRLFLALPALALASTLGGAPGEGGWQFGRVNAHGNGSEWRTWGGVGGVAAVCAFLTWFYALARRRSPRGLRDLTAYALGYAAQATGYFLLLTDRYPSADPARAEAYAELPPHPVRLVVSDPLERSRLTVFFRLLLAIPHLIWLSLWAIAAFFAVVAAWFAALVTGSVPASLRRFLAAFVRYGTHVYAYVTLVGARFPGFVGQEGSYGVDLQIDPAERQSRWTILFRLFLAIPAFFVSSALGGALFVTAFLQWWYALVTGRATDGLRNLGAVCLRYSAQTNAYLLLLTPRYPHASPLLEPPRPVEEPAVPPATAPTGGLDDAGRPEQTTRPSGPPLALFAAGVLTGLALAGGAILAHSLTGSSASGRAASSLWVEAPSRGCWSVALGRDMTHLGPGTIDGCGSASMSVDGSNGIAAQVSKRPASATWPLGGGLAANGRIVREVIPAPVWGLRLTYDRHATEALVLVRVRAADDGCWIAVIEHATRRGCGDQAFAVDVRGDVNVALERAAPGTWRFAASAQAPGRYVQNVGPTTNPDAVLAFVYDVTPSPS